MINDQLRAWIEVQKFPRHSNDVFSFVLGSVLAWYATGAFHWGVFIAGLMAVFFMANGIYLTNEYQDYESDSRNSERIGGVNSGMGMDTTGGTRVLVNGRLNRRHVYLAGMAFFVLCIPLGLLIQFGFHTGPWTIPLGIVGLFFTYGYSNPPIKASYRGMGELFMMLGYAALVFTAYYIQSGPSWFPLVVCLPRILSVPALKLLRNIPDAAADSLAGKRTLVIMIGKARAGRLYVGLIAVSVATFIPAIVVTGSIFILLNIIPAYFLISSAIPIARGLWNETGPLSKSCRDGFKGLLLIPITLTLTFILNAVTGL
ncbi:MAG: prenyltransferase [Dehalococcoidales bacterium]|jgi:1,4-dihydroxy-2-naphthoate octaprenyltransferase|nr:prenyltransferase [Dehalococcoidales bacterium]MDD5122149.1 prenyltransferase [Dehalococcoidales bacterium]MDD5498665.1 prenyltransferase [Dehalococcoidales bacterium]MDX9803079.1 prenyltransferase [Dehalococcoidales bacterium]